MATLILLPPLLHTIPTVTNNKEINIHDTIIENEITTTTIVIYNQIIGTITTLLVLYIYYYYSSSIGTTAHCGLWPIEQCPSIFFLSATNSLHLLTPITWRSLSTSSFHFSWVVPFFSSLPVLEWRSFWASYPPPFSLGDLTSLSFALLSILLYFLLCLSLLDLDLSNFSIPRFHVSKYFPFKS